ncbi:helix-turn-helix domain-containing protein [Hymenobacter gummosus]|uniref:Helix-turn-helix domain-containing protein n=1 Tax=Hymenobacter gummosus TaxID=1776032 RepID=A0A3S0QLJ6_9BACT|nr:helix-turn-helix domain-containing protein [Hymenobacter gummosus]
MRPGTLRERPPGRPAAAGTRRRHEYPVASLPNSCYHCRSCGRTRRTSPGHGAYSEAHKAKILRAYQERTSLRGLTRVFGVSRQTVTAWLKKSPAVTAAGPDTGAGAAG